jgi:hypothetical protein
VILNPSYELIFNFDVSQCPNRHGNEFYYRREFGGWSCTGKHKQLREEGNLSVR